MKKVLISILTLIFIVSMVTTIYAATGSINIGASSDTVKKGGTFTVTVVGTAEANIKAMEANLIYETSRLSIVKKEAGEGFSDLSGNNEIAITASNSDNLSKSGTLYTITFKVSEDAIEGETTISITNAVLALVDADNTEESSDYVSIKITSDATTEGDEGTSDGTQPDNGDNNPSNTPSDDGDNNSDGDNNPDEDTPKDETTEETEGNKKEETKEENKKEDTTTKKEPQLAQTGVEYAGVIAIVILGAISIVSYVSYRKYKNI